VITGTLKMNLSHPDNPKARISACGNSLVERSSDNMLFSSHKREYNLLKSFLRIAKKFSTIVLHPRTGHIEKIPLDKILCKVDEEKKTMSCIYNFRKMYPKEDIIEESVFLVGKGYKLHYKLEFPIIEKRMIHILQSSGRPISLYFYNSLNETLKKEHKSDVLGFLFFTIPSLAELCIIKCINNKTKMPVVLMNDLKARIGEFSSCDVCHERVTNNYIKIMYDEDYGWKFRGFWCGCGIYKS
jgi:hypothetical protein